MARVFRFRCCWCVVCVLFLFSRCPRARGLDLTTACFLHLRVFALLSFSSSSSVGRADRGGGGGAGDFEQEHLLREQNAIHSSLQSATGVLG